MSVKRESTVYRFVSERKTQVVIEQTRFLNTVFLYSEFNASPGLLRATAGHLPGALTGNDVREFRNRFLIYARNERSTAGNWKTSKGVKNVFR